MMTKAQMRGALFGVAILLAVMLCFRLGALYHEQQANMETTTEAQQGEVTAEVADSTQLFPFDPNTVTLKELISMGLNKREAVSIIKFRAAGKVYRIKEDLYTCYDISDSLYFRLEPYIVIGKEFQLEPRSTTTYKAKEKKSYLKPSKFLMDTVGAKYMVAIGALTRRQAAVFVKWRDLSGIYDIEEFRECYVVSDSIAKALEPYIIFTPREEVRSEPIDLNKADSATLRSVVGIGEKSVVAIIDYREKLGGFHSVEQLSELNVVTESNFELIIQQISCDSCDISKIDVNFASAEIMVRHPYFTRKAVRRLLKLRQLKGGWSTTEEIIKDNILDSLEAARLRPYLDFGVHNTRQYP